MDQINKNPLLERVRLPGEIHQLPSRGVFYTDGELADYVKDGELEVKAMIGVDELTMRNPDLLFSGDAAKQVISRCVPGVLKPERLLQKDMDFLMTALRKASYGPELTVNYTHTCQDAKDHSYVINLDDFLRSIRKIDPTTIGSKFTVKLPNEQVVKIMPLRYEFIIEMMQTTYQELKPDQRHQLVVKSLLSIIDSVDTIKDKRLIQEWLEAIPIGWSKQLETAIDSAQTEWGPDFNFKLLCKDCNETISVAAPMNPLTFFI